jgi:general nucleoside transport system ATP-binding protein
MDAHDTAPDQALLALDGITKTYGTIVANDAVSLNVRRGHIHAVLGENGAGKSTLMKIIYGVTQPDAGVIRWRGDAVSVKNPAHARTLGIGMVFQHFSLFETMTVVENISLGVPFSSRVLAPKIVEIGRRLRLDVDPEAPVHALSVGERQRVEIIRCLLQDPELIIMDEPTAVLPPSAVPSLFATLRQLADEGRAVIFISHKLEEIRALCHTATVMRQGRVVATTNPQTTSADALARLMIGRSLPHAQKTAAPTQGRTLLVVDDLSTTPTEPHAVSLDHVTLRVRAGEIVGIAGVSGNGQTELLRLLSGEELLLGQESPRIRLDEKAMGELNPHARRRLGLAFVPEDRLGRGAVASLSLTLNALLTGSENDLVGNGLIRFSAVKKFAQSIVSTYDVRCSGVGAEARSLSGGNLQKFIMGREIELNPEVLIVAQPTWGLDVGATAAIRQKLLDVAARGVAILVVSEELDELLEVADRLHVIFRGRLSPSVPARGASVDRIGLAMTGAFEALSDEEERKLAHA